MASVALESVAEMIMQGVSEYAEEMDVELITDPKSQRLVVQAFNEGGHNCTRVDILDLIEWVLKNRPDLIREAVLEQSDV